MAAEIGCVEWYEENEFRDTIDYPFLVIDEEDALIFHRDADGRQLISVLYFINKLRMSEEEAEKLEDDRVVFNLSGYHWSRDGKVLNIPKGYIAKTNKDGTEVTLHKR